MSGLHSLATIIKRLEAATARLEDAAETIEKGRSTPETSDNTNAQQASAPDLPVPKQVEIPASVTVYEDMVLETCVKPFVELTNAFAVDALTAMVGLFNAQMQGVREFLFLSANCQHPPQEEFEALIEPLRIGIEAMTNAKDGNRKDRDWSIHLAFIAEAAPVSGWVLSPKPALYVGDIKESVDYYGNKLIKEWKEKDPKHVEWARAFGRILDEIKKYAQEYHTTGLAWNPKGITVQEFKSTKIADPTTSALSPAPPPPPPPPPTVAVPPPAPASTGVAAVFAELNRGEEVTKGLRKVDKSEMTHKNPALRAGGTVPAGTSTTAGRRPTKPSKPQALAGKKPSKFALEGNKWLVEHYENLDNHLTVKDVEISHVVNIFGCKNTTIVIKGKVNAVTVVNCSKTSVLVDSAVSSISVTRSPSFQLQVTGAVPMIQIDSTDSGQIYLSQASLTAEITTAKCSAINVNLPVEGEEDGIFAEQAIPEMLKTCIKDGKLITSVVEHVG
ncbi:hypothetical protein AX17_005103 [Amanita inopinata Kibby_2008]|nr:hypothetical protein AX17_005103 [Amanita inopinata Kibby_2008]